MDSAVPTGISDASMKPSTPAVPSPTNSSRPPARVARPASAATPPMPSACMYVARTASHDAPSSRTS